MGLQLDIIQCYFILFIGSRMMGFLVLEFPAFFCCCSCLKFRMCAKGCGVVPMVPGILGPHKRWSHGQPRVRSPSWEPLTHVSTNVAMGGKFAGCATTCVVSHFSCDLLCCCDMLCCFVLLCLS